MPQQRTRRRRLNIELLSDLLERTLLIVTPDHYLTLTSRQLQHRLRQVLSHHLLRQCRHPTRSGIDGRSELLLSFLHLKRRFSAFETPLLSGIGIDAGGELAHQVRSEGHSALGVVGIQEIAEAAVDLSFEVLAHFGILSILADEPAHEGSEVGVQNITTENVSLGVSILFKRQAGYSCLANRTSRLIRQKTECRHSI